MALRLLLDFRMSGWLLGVCFSIFAYAGAYMEVVMVMLSDFIVGP